MDYNSHPDKDKSIALSGYVLIASVIAFVIFMAITACVVFIDKLK